MESGMNEGYLKNQAYDLIRDKIMRCEYEPGAVLNEAQLVEQLGMSRTPIRAALSRLEMENMITIVPKKCIIVNKITISDILEVYEAREVIEPAVIRMYGKNLDKALLQQYYQKHLDVQKSGEKIELDEEFHQMIYDVCNNSYLKELMGMVQLHSYRNRVWRSNEKRVNESVREHLEILECLIREDYDTAAQCMQKHFQKAKAFALQKYI